MDEQNPGSQAELTDSPGLEPVSLDKKEFKAEPKKKKRSKKPFILIVVLMFMVGSVLGWLFIRKNKEQNKEITAQTNITSQPEKQNEGPRPYAVAYSYGDSEKSGFEFFWRPITGGDRSVAKNIGTKNYIAQSDVYKNQVLVITTPGSGSSDGTIIWYSNDSGKSYEKLIGLDLPKPDELGQQITSAVFSKDGSKLIYGYLATAGKANTVRQIDLKTKEVTDLFSVNTPGIFLKAFDSEKKQVYYFSGCYNCDGNTQNKLFVRDLSTRAEAVLYSTPDKIGVGVVFRDDYSKVLIVEGVQSSQGIGAGVPYTITEFDINSNSFKELLVIKTNESAPQAGYRDGDSSPYYSDGNTLNTLAADGTKTVVFEANKPIVNVLYVAVDQVIASSGTFQDYVLTSYVVKTKTTTEILKGDQSTSLFGVIWK